MIDQFRIALSRSADTLAADFLGVASLVVMLIAALHLPGVF